MKDPVKGRFHQASRLFSTDLELGVSENQAMSSCKLLTAKIILSIVMIAEIISPGILAFPKNLSALGPIPGVTAIVGVGLISTYTGYTIGQLKQRIMQIRSMEDAGGLLVGKLGRRALEVARLLFLIFVMGSHFVTSSAMMNVLTKHTNCTAFYAFLGVLISFILTLPRRLERLSDLSSISFISILGAVLMSRSGLSGNRNSARLSGFSPTPTVREACLAVANIVFAYAARVASFTLFSELRNTRGLPKARKGPNAPKALAILQACEMLIYALSATVVYAYVGNEVISPAFNSAGRLFRMISFGIAIPTVFIGGVVDTHVAVKLIYVHLVRSTNAWITWTASCAGLWILPWITAEGTPVFNYFLEMASSVSARWFTFGLPGMFWLYLDRHMWLLTWRQIALFLFNVTLLVLASIICVIGLYSSIWSIYQNVREGFAGVSFSYADNTIF